MRIAVIGAAGVAGRAFVPVARLGGHELGTSKVDLFDYPALEAALRGFDAVSPFWSMANHVRPTLRALINRFNS
jgi:putative NADH-flavin reductase